MKKIFTAGVILLAAGATAFAGRPYRHPCLCPTAYWQHSRPDCFASPEVVAAVDLADVVFHGKIVEITRDSVHFETVVEMEVIKYWKGHEVPGTVIVRTPIGLAEGKISFRAPVDAKEAVIEKHPEFKGEYIVYGRYVPSYDGVVEVFTSGPSRTRMAHLAKLDFDTLGDGTKPKAGAGDDRLPPGVDRLPPGVGLERLPPGGDSNEVPRRLP